MTAQNIEGIVRGCDLVLDGTDNMETRFLINDACLKTGVPWIYGGALGSVGMTMTIIPHKTPCLRCFVDCAPAPGTMPSCDTEGVLSAVTGTIASTQSAEALRLLMGLEPAAGILYVDLWERDFSEVDFERNTDCPACWDGQI